MAQGLSRAPGPLGMGCLMMVAGLLGLVTLLAILPATGFSGLAVGLVAALCPVPFYLGLALWLDRYEPEPAWLLALAFLYGATAAAFFSLVGSNAAAGAAARALGGEAAGWVGAVLAAPFFEELAKGAGILAVTLWVKHEFDGIVDGFVYATVVGLGFATTENILYYGRAAAEAGAAGLVVTMVLRGMVSPYAHPLFTSFTGIGLGWAQQSDRLEVKIAAPLGGLGAAMGFHSLWNLTATLHGGLWLATYFLVMLPALLAVLGVVGFSLAREGRLVRQNLRAEVAAGRLTPAELSLLGSVTARMGQTWRAFRSGGVRSWRACRRFQQAATELAFLRDRVQRGLVPAQQARQVAEGYRAELESLRELFPG